MNLTPKYAVNDRYQHFICTKAVAIEELQAVLYEMQHEPTGATVMHIACDDKENLFCLSFQTLPADSTGVAHILEHTVLCGSKKFPIKDPFFSMTRRSLNTFMNAMTGSDFTCYPASSQVEKDFYNLLEVYLDAVFFPQLKEASFLQEGHRLEFEKPEDPASPLLLKGVVFNEMKGSLSSPETRLWKEILKEVTPDLPYAFDSGGDPKEIPSLTYEVLKNFHATYYHPSRCLFYFYGNLPIEKHLDFITKHALEAVEKLPPLPPIQLQKRFESPHFHTFSYPIHDKDLRKKTFIAFSWLTTNIREQQDVLALSVLDSILVETDASPLKFALLKSDLCMQADGYLDLEMSEIPYVIICRGCEEQDREKLKDVIMKTLETIMKTGIDPKLVQAAIHQLEFNRLEITGDAGPFGLTLFMRSALAKQHGCPPENALTVYQQFQNLQERVEDPSYFRDLIGKYLLHNPHLVQIVMSPDPSLEEKEATEEREKLQAIQKELTQEDIDRIDTQTEMLHAYQEETEHQSVECLPKIGLEDVPKEVTDFPLYRTKKEPFSIYHHECFTNHILYADLAFDLPPIHEEELCHLQLLFSLLAELGVADRSYKENLEYINAYLGGFHATLTLHPQYRDPNHLSPAFGFRGKALSRNADKLFALLKDFSLSPRLDEKDRIEELLLQIYTLQQNKLNRNALSYAISLSLSNFSPSSAINQKLSGIDYYQFIQNLVQNRATLLSPLLDKLNELKERIFRFSTPHLILSCDAAEYERIEKKNFFGLLDLPTQPTQKWKELTISTKISSQGRPISSPVAFSALGFKTCHAPNSFAPALSLATKILENTQLHKKIREKGGAYGAGASYNPVCGHFYFYAYRDPHIAATYQVFTEAIEAIANKTFTDQDLEEAKLGIIQEMDTPTSPGSRAIISYSQQRDRRTKEVRQHYRDLLLATTKEEVAQAVASELGRQVRQGIAVSFANQTLIEEEGKDLPIIPI